MVNLNLRDTHMMENLKSIKFLRDNGYTDEELQKLYDGQVKRDKQKEGK